MEPPNDKPSTASGDCCGGSSCACGGTPPKRRSWLKIALFTAVMLAAAGVGTWSLLARTAAPVGKDCKTECGSTGCCGK